LAMYSWASRSMSARSVSSRISSRWPVMLTWDSRPRRRDTAGARSTLRSFSKTKKTSWGL
jgi:hypothetical protein